MKRVLRAVRRRLPRRAAGAAFDPALYRRLHPDLADLPDDAALERHWRAHGQAEDRLGSLSALIGANDGHLGRLPQDFDVAGYRLHNDDLRDALPTSRAAVDHYLRYGRREARRYYPDAPPPGASTEQLAEAVGRHPECIVALYELASAQRNSGRWDQVVTTLRPARTLAPADVRTALLYMHGLHAIGAHDQAAAESVDLARLNGVGGRELATLDAFGDYLRSFPRSEALRVLQEVRGRYAWARASRVAAEINAAITERRGFALARLGPGEGAFAQISTDDEARFAALYQANRESMRALAFGPGFDPAVTDVDARLFSLMPDAMEADICGVPCEPWIEREYGTANLNGPPPLLNVHRWLIEHEPGSKPLLCDHAIDIDLHTRGLLLPILRRSEAVTLISSNSDLPEQMQRRFGLPKVELFDVPGARGAGGARRAVDLEGIHDSDVFDLVMARLAQPQSGRVFLIAAGLLTGFYALQVKRHGGVALDIGSLADRWAWIPSRPDHDAGMAL